MKTFVLARESGRFLRLQLKRTGSSNRLDFMRLEVPSQGTFLKRLSRRVPSRLLQELRSFVPAAREGALKIESQGSRARSADIA